MKKKVLSVLLSASILAASLSTSLISMAKTEPELVGSSVSDWGAHNYVAVDGEAVTSALTPLANGSIQVSGDQVTGGKGIGATYTKPIYLDQGGFSINCSFDQYDANSQDKWFAVALMDRVSVTNEKNAEPVFKQWDNTDAKDPAEGKGLIIIMRPRTEGWITLEMRYYGVASNTDATSANNGYVYIGDGSYDNIRLNSSNYQNIKLDFVKLESGGYNLIFNEGAYARVNGNGETIDRVDGNGEINPAVKLNLVDAIFPTGTPAYLQMVAYNAANYETKFSVNKINGKFANLANTLDSWGLHNYTAADGSVLESEMTADDNGNLVVSGIQAAGEGELGVTYARPIDMANGFSLEFSLDNYQPNGVNGVDSWISLQIKDKMQITDSKNESPVFHKMDAGGGRPEYGSGLVILMRPLANNQLGIGEIFWNGVKFAPDTSAPSTEQNWEGDANGCYSQIQLDSFKNVKISFVPNGAGFYIRINDGNYTRVGADRVDASGEINPANSYVKLRKFFDQATPAYLSLVYHHSVDSTQAQFTIHSVNGQQAVPNTLSGWGAHNYVDITGSSIVSDIAADTNGGLSVSGNQTAGNGGIGATWLRPIDMANGVSVEFSLDNYRLNGVNGVDSFIAVHLMDKSLIRDTANPDGAYRHFEASGDPTYGSGLVMLIRPLSDNSLGIGEIYWNGVKFTPEVSKETNFQNDANGCYSQIKVLSFQNIKIAFVPAANGSFDIVFNDGDYLRVGADRMNNDHGKINVANGYSNLSKLFSNHNFAYIGLTYKDSTSQDAQFTIHKVNGLTAVVPESDAGPEEVINGVYELFRDLKFENGFRVTGMDSPTEGSQPPYYFKYGNDSLRPIWKLAQWDSKYNFRDEDVTMFYSPEDNVYIYENPSKVVTVDTNTGEIGLRLNASAVYDNPREANERWPHLLLEQSLTSTENKFAFKLKNAEHLRLQLSQKLTFFQDHMGEDANPSLHAGSLYLYLYVKGTNSKGSTEMMWFGIPLFDNRYPFPGEAGIQDGGKDDASGLFIYNVPSRGFTNMSFTQNGTPVGSEDNDWMNIDIDLIPTIKRALVLANQKGFMQGVTMDTLFVDGMNLGWEMPGTYDAEMKIKNLSLKSYVGTDYSSNSGIFNFLVSEMEEKENLAADSNLSLTVPNDVLEIDDFTNSLLTIQAKKRASAAGVSIPNSKVSAVYDMNLVVNGNPYNYAFDKPTELVYNAGEGDISSLKFYTVNADGSGKLIDGQYNKEENTFRFVLDKSAAFAVVDSNAIVDDKDDEQDDKKDDTVKKPDGNDGNPETGDTAALPLTLGMFGIALGALYLKKRKKQQG